MTDILLAIIAGILLSQIIYKSDATTNEIWAEYLVILIGSAIVFGVALGLNALASMFGFSL